MVFSKCYPDQDTLQHPFSSPPQIPSNSSHCSEMETRTLNMLKVPHDHTFAGLSVPSQTIISLDFCPQLQQSEILRQQLRYDLCQCCLNISASSEPNFHCLVNLHSSFVTYLQSQIQGSPF